MKWTPWLFGSLTAVLIAGCGGDKRNNDTGTAGGAGSESGTMQGGPGTATDTAMRSSDTTGTQPGATGGTSSDTARSGYTKTRPDQGQPVTSKGDTIGTPVDSAPGNQ
jgi:hypothetical protein